MKKLTKLTLKGEVMTNRQMKKVVGGSAARCDIGVGESCDTVIKCDIGGLSGYCGWIGANTPGGGHCGCVSGAYKGD